jgi:hypothetical protein
MRLFHHLNGVNKMELLSHYKEEEEDPFQIWNDQSYQMMIFLQFKLREPHATPTSTFRPWHS